MKNLILIFFSFILFSCNKDEEVAPIVTPFEPIIINSELVGKGQIGTDVVVQQNTIINSEPMWLSFKNQLDAFFIANGLGNYFTETFFTETNIDFTNYTVIVVIDQWYSYGGHSIDITAIMEYETNIIVTVENLQEGNTSPIAIQPYHIVKIPKATKPIVFE